MTIIGTLARVELTREEIETITSALHEKYKTLSAAAATDAGTPAGAAASIDAGNARRLRDSFSDIIGRRYMGEDA